MTEDGRLTVDVSDLVGSPGKARDVSGTRDVELRLGGSSVEGPVQVRAKVVGTLDGVQADFTASSLLHLQCVRCLTEWDEPLEVSGSQHYSIEPDEDGYSIEGVAVDVFPTARDELSLAIPAAPICRQGCAGLCPICGTDLNSEPCDGHGEESNSPFAVLKDLFDS